MRVSESAKRKIMEMEGCRLKAYRCPSGVLTIGYGHTGADVKPGMEITQEQAESLFGKDIERFCSSVDVVIGGANLTQCQHDALVSFAYNVGIGAFGTSTLLKKVKSWPDNPAIRDEFAKWVYGGGKRLPGLVKRRGWEAARYFGEE